MFKNRFSLALRTFAAMLVLSLCGYSQHQRLAMRPGTVTLGPHGKAMQEAFCLDRHLFAAQEFASYPHIITPGVSSTVEFSGGRKMTLQNALAEGLLAVRGGSGDGAQIRFDTSIGLEISNKTNEQVRINMPDPIAFGEQPGGLEIPLESLRTHSLPAKSTQSSLWGDGKTVRYLRVLDYLDDAGFSPSKLEAAVSRYQVHRKLSPSGDLNEPTRSALEADITAAAKRLEAIGFPIDDSGRSPDLSQAIDDYQRYLGLPRNGRLDTSTLMHLRNDGKMLADMRAALAAPGLPPFLASRPQTKVLSLQRMSGREVVLANSNAGTELWSFSNGQVARSRGEQALLQWDQSSGELTEEFADENTVIVHFGSYRKGRPGLVWLDGEQIPFDPEGKSFLQFFSDPEVKTAFTKFADKKNGKPNLVIYRDGSFQGVGGDALPGKSPFEEAGRQRVDPQEIAYAAASILGDRYRVGLANDLSLGVKNATTLPSLQSGADITVMVDGESKGDFRTFDNVGSALADAAVEFVEANHTPNGSAKIFLFAEHNSEGYRKRVLQLAKEGHFRGGILATAVCGLGGEAGFNSEIIRAAGAKAVLYYPMEIEARAVQKVILKFAELLQERGKTDGDFRALWDQSVDAAYAEAKSESMRGSIKKLRRALMQYSELYRGQENVNGD